MQTASAVRALTIEAHRRPTLGELDLAQRVDALRGPDADIHQAFDVARPHAEDDREGKTSVEDSEDVPAEDTAATPLSPHPGTRASAVSTAR